MAASKGILKARIAVPAPSRAEDKGKAVAVEGEEADVEGGDSEDDSDEEGGSDADSFDLDGLDDGEEPSEDEDDELEEMNAAARPIKKLKNKTLRPTAASEFSSALTHLLSLPTPARTTSLAPIHAPPTRSALRLDRKTRAVLRDTKAQHLARGHVRDVIAGWGPRPPVPFSHWANDGAAAFERAARGGTVPESGAERERRLRKLAQKGVVRLFNAINAAQGTVAKPEESKKRQRTEENGEEEGDAPRSSGTAIKKPNVLGGRGKAETLSNLSKASFLDLIRSGTTTAA